MAAEFYVEVPEHEKLPGGMVISLATILGHVLNEDKRFFRNRRGMLAAERIDNAFRDQPAGTVVALHPDDKKLLCEVLEEPTCGYPELLGKKASGEMFTVPIDRRVTLRLIDSVISAKSERPAKPAPVAVAAE